MGGPNLPPWAPRGQGRPKRGILDFGQKAPFLLLKWLNLLMFRLRVWDGQGRIKVPKGFLKVSKGFLKVSKGFLKASKGFLKVSEGFLKISKGLTL